MIFGKIFFFRKNCNFYSTHTIFLKFCLWVDLIVMLHCGELQQNCLCRIDVGMCASVVVGISQVHFKFGYTYRVGDEKKLCQRKLSANCQHSFAPRTPRTPRNAAHFGGKMKIRPKTWFLEKYFFFGKIVISILHIQFFWNFVCE